MRFLFAALVLLSCASKPRLNVVFVDESEKTSDVWICLFAEDDVKHEKLLCGDLRTFLKTAKSGHDSESGMHEL